MVLSPDFSQIVHYSWTPVYLQRHHIAKYSEEVVDVFHTKKVVYKTFDDQYLTPLGSPLLPAPP